ncbi:MAG: tRNA (guanosine(46)-N7)-methyltransferase TrmB [Leptolyngbya sp. DLM2.Bin15]|nr:MAG: tRNA (guanosine(46)-N7)-methyltransferase TrmB [Leptolyngbya sp. DLM2.Bin15]
MLPASTKKRVRQHVNPLSAKYGTPLPPPNWAEIFADPSHPLHLDIGSARGQFAIAMAQQWPDWNFLGLEIREPLVEAAQRQAQALTNAHFLFGNANNSLRGLLTALPPGVLRSASIQFPDPWFKKRHQKRRVVQPELVHVLAEVLPAHGQVFLQSDIESVAVAMGDRFSEHGGFVRSSPDWLNESPFPVQTERETVTLSQGKPVYRALYVRT